MNTLILFTIGLFVSILCLLFVIVSVYEVRRAGERASEEDR
jgi:cbb3-type cytochrome oxidase subunit 3